METKFGFTKLSLAEFEDWIKNLKISRTIIKVQQHHTYLPSYIHFNGSNHFERQKAMKDYHVNQNGWNDIGQHFTIFPDGSVLTGRSLEKSPACITGQNANSVCIENFGDFDKGKDIMTTEQAQAIVKVTAFLCSKFNLPINTNSIVYHHWFHLSTGVRNNGSGGNKSCPGTNFFGGNKVADCENNFLPLVANALKSPINSDITDVKKFVCVNVNSLNIRVSPSTSSAKAPERPSANLGAILRVYGEQNGWLKISSSESRWVAERYTTVVKRAVVNANSLNVRTGAGTNFPRSGSLTKGDVIFVIETSGTWCKIAMEEKWVSKQYLSF